MAQPVKQRASWAVRSIVVVMAGLLGYGIFVGVQHGMACQTGAIHPHVKQVDAAVHQDLAVVQRLANAPKAKGWSIADVQAVIAADATMTTTLTGLRLSMGDRAVVTTWLTHVRHFDTALSTYMANDSEANHALFAAGAVELQKGADALSTGLAGLPKQCRLN